uniref:Uncharacterized protein n=1 Tax=Anopheles quadriannulatus TaxID=34691 RepID=A0A182XLV7_ANOQN
HEISDGSGSSEKGDDKFLLRRDELSVFDTRKSSLSAVEVSTLDDDSPLLTDFTTSSITYVSDRIDSSSLDLMVGEQSMNFLKIGSSMAPPDEKRHDIQSPGSCMSFTTTTSENIESISHDVESRSNFGGTLQPDIPTEYERSVSLSDNAASDYSNESATKYNLPYDTESDGHDAGAHKARLRGIKSQEGIAEPKQVKSAKLIAVDQRHGSASPQSDITEYTESVSYVDSIIDSTNYESALKQKETKQELRSKETSKDSCEADVKPSTVAADRETKVSKLDTTAKPSSESVESAHPKRRSKSKTTVTKVNLHKQAPIDISKRSTKTVDIRMGAAESTVTVSKSATTSSRISTTATRTHGYMQSTLSRDQKVLRPLTLTDSPHSSPSKTSHRAGTASITSTHTTYSPAHSAERKATKPSKPGSAATPGVPEGATSSTKHGVSSTGARKIESKFTTKSATGRSSSTVVTTSSTVSTSSTSSQSRLSRSSVTSSARKASTKADFKEQPVVKKADKEQANLVTKSTLPAAVKTSKDRVNKSLIPVKVQSSKRDATPSPTKTASKSKPKSAPGPKPKGEPRMSKPIAVSERTATKKEHSVQLITKSIPKVTSTVHRKESAKQIIDDVYRCKSAMHYSYKDAVTFDHAEVPSSLPSSPSRLNKSSSNSTNVLTSEVFTRTIDSSKSIEVIYKQPSTSHELYRRVQGEYNRYNDADLNFIETTDSSLSDSIALPSSSSEQESDATGKQRRSGSPEGSPKQTSSSSAVTTTMTTLAGRKNLPQHYPHHPVHQHVATKHGSSGSSASGKRARTHSPAEPRYRKSDIWSRTDPPASSQELPDTSEDSDSYYYHHQQHCLFQQQQQHQQHQQLPPVAGIADRRLTVSLDGIVLESSISPILDFRASTPPRMKYKFDYDSSLICSEQLYTKSTNYTTPGNAQTMADIPLISITQECSDDEELSTSSATNKLNIEDALTDTEDLMMDGAGQRERKSASSSPIPPEPNSLSLLEALQSPLAGAVTDVEDCSDTSDEEERDKKPTREVDISLDDFLDQGYVDEMTKSDQRGAKPKILTRSCSKAAEGPSSKSLMVCADVAAALTDCEDCAMSGEDGDTSVVPDCPDDILMRQDADNGMVDIHNAVRRRQDKHLPRAEQQAAQSSSSDSDEPECKVVRHRKPHRKGVVEQRSNISDCENILVSEEESSSLAKPGPASAFEADEVTMEASDHETEQSVTFPEINICFVTDGDAGDEPAKQCSSRPSTLTVGQANADEAVTDVENLDSSDSETSAPQRSKRLMPRAVARGGKGGGLTDVEDFNASDEEQDGQSPQDVGGEEHSFLPSPTREIAIMRGDGSGEQTANVMPLNHTYLLARTPDIEQALTDFEDLAVNDDEKLYDDAKYTIEALPEMDNDTVYASENTPAPPKPNWLDQAHEPLTDTEDIFFDRAAGPGPGAAVSFGSNELRRRRKPKGTAATQSYKGKTFLDTSATGQENGSAAATTDVEDLYLSDDDAAAVSSFPPTDRSKQRRATIQVPPQHHTGDSAKTDIEYLSGDEYVSDRTVPSPTVCPDGFHSTIKSRDRLGGDRSGQQALGVPGCPAPTISRTSPTPDGANCHTDCEEIQGASDEEEEETMDGAAKRDPEQESMARTATPFELRRALDESGSCEIHDALVGSTRRHRGDRKRPQPNDGQEMPTDMEFLDEDGAIRTPNTTMHYRRRPEAKTTTPRLVSQTVEAAAPPASAVSDAFVSGQCVAIAATSTSTVTTTAANLLTDANDVATADQCFTASAANVERTEQSVLSTTTSTIGSISNAEQSFSIASTEPDRPSESSSSGGGGGFDGQPVPKPRTSISSRTDTATRSSLLESFENQDSIEQYPEPAPVQSAEPDLRLRQGSITSDELSNVAQKDSSELVTSEEDISSGAKFFIGECSSDIITRSSTEKRSDFAFDNEGYTFSQESQGTDDQESRRDAMEAYQQQIKLEDGFTLDSLKELDIAGLQSSGKPPVVHSPVTAPATVQPFAETQSVKSEVDVGEATILESTTTEQQEQQQQYAHMTIDELTIAKTLEEVKESLDAVQEELIEAVTDGTPIKQSPSEFEFKILPSTRYVQDPIYETNQEEAVAVSTATAAAITTTTIVSESGLSDSETRSLAAAASAPPIKIDEAPTAAGSSDSSQLEASPRLRHGPAAAKGNRWSATDVDSSGESHYQSFEHTDSSRPLSSDLEQVLPYASSEYETALDHSMVPTSLGTEYHSAVSTLHSYPVSSHDSMKSFDSESSGNLASIESEATETLVPSTMDVDFDSSDAALIHDDSEDDLRDKLLLLDDKEEPSSAASSSVPIAMKRSHEMDFAELKGESVADESLLQFGEQRSHGVESVSSSFQEEKLLSSSIGTARDLVEAMQATSLEDVKTEPADDGKLGTSLEDGSILSISLSSASNLETIMENLSDKTTSIGPVPTHVEIGLDAVTPTSAGTTAGYIGDITLTSTTLKEGDVNFLNTQATTEMIEVSESAELIAGREDSEETVRKRGHKRTESTAIISGKFMAEMGENRDSIESQDESLSQDASKPPTTSSERDETRDESSDSDYDRYESEYARSFRAPVAQPKKKDKKAGDVFEKDFELDRRNSFSPSQSVIETIVEDVHAEIEQGDEAQQIMVSKSQRLQEYRESSTHNIPDIHVTEDFAEQQQQQQSSDGEDETKREATVFSETVSVVETVTKTQADATVSSSATTVRKVTTETASTSAGMTMAKQTGIQYAKQEEFQLTEEQYQELIEQKYKAKLADSTTKYAFDADDKDDSAGSDSFEMLEQPDISDEFVIVEEVAREAHEFDAEGKSVAIKPTKIEKKHDEDVEKILVKSAPAHTNAGSLYAANMRDDMMYEFEESPPTGGAEGVDGGAGVTMDLLNNGYPLEESKRWVEMQLAETQNFRYPYEDRLEDIKEEDTDFEVGSSRIGSIKDSFSSTPDYDLLAKRMASREHDDISMSSLQEFENLEHVISLENRKMQQGSQDSLSNGSFTRRFMQRGMHGDDISLSSLKEFEGLENACLEAHLIEIKAKEEAALLLSRSDESNKSNGSNGAKRSPPSNGAAAVGSRQQSTEGAAATKIISSSTSITTTVVGGAVGSSVPSGEMTKVERKITTASGSGREGSSTTTVTTITHVEGQTRQGFDEEDSTSHHILTVSSDSLDGTRVKQPLASGRDAMPSAHSSSDSLDMHSKNNVDPMTSSIDSIEFSKTGIATTRSSQSDSIEQMAQQQQQPNRSDSTDSIEAQQQLQQQQKLQHHQTYHQTTTQQTLSDTKRDSLESLAASSSDNQSGFSSPTKSAHGSRPLSDSGVGASGTTAHHHQQQQQQQFHHQTTTMSMHTVSTGGRTMQKDISADSLTGPDAAFLTSTESLETSSTATNATYQNETDSQMSSSVTSCDSITMVDTVGPSQSLEHWDSSFTAGVHGGGFGASSLMTSSSMSAYSSGVVGSSGGTTIQQQQQQHAFRTSHAEASSSIRMSSSTSSSSTVTMVASSASSTSVRTAQQQLMGESELLSRELFPG